MSRSERQRLIFSAVGLAAVIVLVWCCWSTVSEAIASAKQICGQGNIPYRTSLAGELSLSAGDSDTITQLMATHPAEAQPNDWIY